MENRDVERDTPPPPPPPVTSPSFPLTPPKLSPTELAAAANVDGGRASPVTCLPLETPPESPDSAVENNMDDHAVIGERQEGEGGAHPEDEREMEDAAVEELEDEDEVPITPPMMDHEYCLSPTTSGRSSLASTPQPPSQPQQQQRPVTPRSSPPPLPSGFGAVVDEPLRPVTAGLRNRGAVRGGPNPTAGYL